jgi:hypothetical protein
MDNLTDLLTNIFVSNKNYKTEDKRLEKLVEETTQKESSSSESSSEKSSESSDSEKSSESSESEKSSESSESEKSSESSESKKSSTSESDSNDDESEEDESEEGESEEGESEEGEEEGKQGEDKTKNDNVKEEVQHIESKVSEKVDKQNFRKLVLKASEFYKRNLVIVNNDQSKNIELLSDLLFKLSKMTTVNELYENSLHIFTFNENKKDFRDMLLENPYLYFNNLVIKNSLSVPKLESSKRHIFIIDYNMISDFEKLNKLLTSNLNLHVILYHNTYTSSLVDIVKLLGKNTLLINNKDRLKILQKRFYSKIVKHLVDETDDYFESINDDNLDVKYLIIKDKELRYS